MTSITEPSKFVTPFAESGLKNAIPATANNATGKAGFDKGFPERTMLPKASGGIPPSGMDFNGILYDITSAIRYMQAGGKPTYDAAFAAAIGGYPSGAVLIGDDGVTVFQNAVDGNATDPNSGGAGWTRPDLQVMELHRRSYAEAGYSVVGTFQAGFTYVNANDVGIDLATGKGFSGPAGTVPAGTNPSAGGFTDRSSDVLRGQLLNGPMKLIGARFAMRDFVSLMDYATGSGTADDITALDAAVAAAPSGAIIFSPPGKTYAISRTWSINKPNIKVLLNGAKIIPLAGTDRASAFNAMKLGAVSDAVSLEGIEVEGAEIDGTSGGFDSGIVINGVKRCYIRNNYVHDVGNPASHTKEAGFGIEFNLRYSKEANEDVFILNNVFKNIGGKGMNRGDFICASFTKRLVIDGNTGIGASRQGVALTTQISDIRIVNNTLSDISLAAIDLETEDKAYDLTQVCIAGNTLTRWGKKPATGGYVGSQFHGIDLHDTANKVIITGNIITDGDPDAVGNSTTAISGINNAKEVIITGNYINNVNRIIHNLSGNIMRIMTIANNICYAKVTGIILAESPEATITGNRITVAGNGYPISMATSSTNPTIITGNVLKTAGVCALRLYGSGLVTTNANFLDAGSLAAPDADMTSIIGVYNWYGTDNMMTITDNMLRGAGSATGIRFVRSGATQKAIVRDNHYSGVTTRIVGMDTNAQVDSGGVQVTAPNGTQWIIKVDNAGVVSAVSGA